MSIEAVAVANGASSWATTSISRSTAAAAATAAATGSGTSPVADRIGDLRADAVHQVERRGAGDLEIDAVQLIDDLRELIGHLLHERDEAIDDVSEGVDHRVDRRADGREVDVGHETVQLRTRPATASVTALGSSARIFASRSRIGAAAASKKSNPSNARILC